MLRRLPVDSSSILHTLKIPRSGGERDVGGARSKFKSVDGQTFDTTVDCTGLPDSDARSGHDLLQAL